MPKLKLDWEASTRDHWVGHLAGHHVVDVERNRSWKRLGNQTPWCITLLRSPFGGGISEIERRHRDLEVAQLIAERRLFVLVKKLAAAAEVL